MDYKVEFEETLTKEQIENIEKMARMVIKGDRTESELAEIRLTDIRNPKRDYAKTEFTELMTKDEYVTFQTFCFSRKTPINRIKYDLEIKRIETLLAWAKTREPDFMSHTFVKRHIEYVQQRRLWRLLKFTLEKAQKGKLPKSYGEWI